MSYIKLSIIIQQWPINIHLHYVCSYISLVLHKGIFVILSLWTRLALSYSLNNIVKLVYLIYDYNPSALVWIFTWLNNPDISCLFLQSVTLLLLNLLLFFNLCVSTIVKRNESFVFGIFETLFNMKCQRNIVKHILSDKLVILFQVVE